MWKVMGVYVNIQPSFMAGNSAYEQTQQCHNYRNYEIRSKGTIFILQVGIIPGSAAQNKKEKQEPPQNYRHQKREMVQTPY
jgi:hypothetical protein